MSTELLESLSKNLRDDYQGANMKTFLLLTLVLTMKTLGAKEVVLFNIQVTNESKVTPLRLLTTKSNEARGIVYENEGKDVFVGVNQVVSARGAVVIQHEGHQLAYLKSRDLDVLRGGNIQLEYVKNVLFGGKGMKQFSLEFDGKEWGAYRAGEKIKTLEIQPGSMGIKDIEVQVQR